jgi:hypothetical protein
LGDTQIAHARENITSERFFIATGRVVKGQYNLMIDFFIIFFYFFLFAVLFFFWHYFSAIKIYSVLPFIYAYAYIHTYMLQFLFKVPSFLKNKKYIYPIFLWGGPITNVEKTWAQPFCYLLFQWEC